MRLGSTAWNFSCFSVSKVDGWRGTRRPPSARDARRSTTASAASCRFRAAHRAEPSRGPTCAHDAAVEGTAGDRLTPSMPRMFLRAVGVVARRRTEADEAEVAFVPPPVAADVAPARRGRGCARTRARRRRPVPEADLPKLAARAPPPRAAPACVAPPRPRAPRDPPRSGTGRPSRTRSPIPQLRARNPPQFWPK